MKQYNIQNQPDDELIEVKYHDNIGTFNIEDETYEIEFVNLDRAFEGADKILTIRGCKFYRVSNGKRVLEDVGSVAPSVVRTIRTAVENYVADTLPDVFGYLVKHTSGHLFYNWFLMKLSRASDQYYSYMQDTEDKMLYVLDRSDGAPFETLEELILSLNH